MVLAVGEGDIARVVEVVALVVTETGVHGRKAHVIVEQGPFQFADPMAVAINGFSIHVRSPAVIPAFGGNRMGRGADGKQIGDRAFVVARNRNRPISICVLPPPKVCAIGFGFPQGVGPVDAFINVGGELTQFGFNGSRAVKIGAAGQDALHQERRFTDVAGVEGSPGTCGSFPGAIVDHQAVNAVMPIRMIVEKTHRQTHALGGFLPGEVAALHQHRQRGHREPHASGLA